MKKSMIILMALTMCISFVGVVNAALVTQTFEGIPDNHRFFNEDDTVNATAENLGGHLSGLDFSAGSGIVTVLDEAEDIYFNWEAYPPYSPTAVIFSESNSAIRVDFDIHTDHVEAWYSSYTAFYLDAYDENNNPLVSSSGLSNITQYPPPTSTGFSSISVDWGSMDIAYVIFHDSGARYTLDNLAYNIPEPATMAILGLGGLFCARLKRR